MNESLILGFFDGVHIAHQAVVKTAVEYSPNTALITLKNFNKTCEYIMSRENSYLKLKSYGVKKIIELDFEEFAPLPAEKFIEYLSENFSPVSISTGFNYTFGRNKHGDKKLLAEYAKKYNYKYFCVDPQTYNNKIISSSLVRELLKNGEIEEANKLLASPFILEGKVIHGAELGRKLGFPTANIIYPENIIKIPYGVYKVKIGQRKGMLNWGVKPTVNNTPSPIIEVHILDFNENLYDKNIKIEVLKKIRDEKKFESLEELKLQIQKDTELCSK